MVVEKLYELSKCSLAQQLLDGCLVLFSYHFAKLGILIGASLSKPHTSETALCTCVYLSIYACLRPYTVTSFIYT